LWILFSFVLSNIEMGRASVDEKSISEKLAAAAAEKGIDKEQLELLLKGGSRIPEDFMDVVGKASEVFNTEFSQHRVDEQD
jgi:hypothetical protein